MIENIKNWFRKAGDSLTGNNELQSIIDHPKIAMSKDEYERIRKNKAFYSNDFPDVEYYNAERQKVTRKYSSINATKIMASELASLVFNEGCTITIDDEGAQEFLNDIFKKSKFTKNFREELETGYAISGLALRPYVDPKTNEIKISYCSADTFYPLNSNTNDVSEAAIVTVSQQAEGQDTIYYTLIEFHEWMDNGKYLITNELYRSKSSSTVGKRVPLTSVDKFENLQPNVFIEGLSRPLFVYIKLAGKNNLSLGSPLGMGVADNGKAQLNNLNDTYDQYMNEVRKSASKLLVSDHFIRTRIDDKGHPIRYMDPDTDIFQLLKGDSDEVKITEFVPTLRTDEFIKTMNFILQIAETNVGFSPGTFSFDIKEGIKTATEVVFENSKTYRTRADNVLLIEEALKELIVTIFELAQAYDLYKGNLSFEINVDFDDGVFTDKDTKLDYYIKLLDNKLMSRKSAMMKALSMSEDEALKELEEINSDTVQSVIKESGLGEIIQDQLMFGKTEV
ncbi:poly(3-hydroxybutyrate) depolymerase [Vagococcus elongatus]|uniref:Poly(3-hydroxybutyrate) depolymerase n=1 Tax=Vagococcus elongatus TaxID=180344 RepID=A0A430AU94_9ENTE|nr:poly(3-hydroxybutyrate) depolymerase [Vagococcus elongatus]